MSHSKLRFGLVLAVLLVFTPTGFGQTNQPAARYQFTAANATEPGPTGQTRLDLVITRWSTDDVRNALFEGANAPPPTGFGPTPLEEAVASAPTTGYIHWPGGLSYALSYARRVARPDGGFDVVLVAQPNPWAWWDAAAAERWESEPFAVFQIRFNSNGVGQGRISHGANIVSNREAGVVIENFENQPVLLTDVRPAT